MTTTALVLAFLAQGAATPPARVCAENVLERSVEIAVEYFPSDKGMIVGELKVGPRSSDCWTADNNWDAIEIEGKVNFVSGDPDFVHGKEFYFACRPNGWPQSHLKIERVDGRVVCHQVNTGGH